jgi:aminoglycoside phosphotransferase (APT) family kinase protein
MPLSGRDLVEEVRALVRGVMGRSGAVTGVEPLQLRPDAAVLLVTITSGRRLVVKLAGRRAAHPVDYERTAMLTELARSTGVPVPEILAADDSLNERRWRYLIAEHIDGIPWRQLRPRLAADQVAAAHRQLAAALLAVQSVIFGAFGELDRSGQPPAGQDLVAALHRRAELRIGDPRARASFHHLLDREAALFAGVEVATLCHDDLHHHNVLFRLNGEDWRLVAVLDWDKAWAGPTESDVARMAFWDDMTAPGFWEVYRASVPPSEGAAERALIYQLLWCFEYDDGSPRHIADTARLRRRLAIP